MEGVHQGVAGHPGQRRRWRLLELALARCPEKQELSARTEKCLECVERACFDADGTDRDKVQRLMKLGAREKLFESRGFDNGVTQSQRANGFTKEHGFARLDLDH